MPEHAAASGGWGGAGRPIITLLWLTSHSFPSGFWKLQFVLCNSIHWFVPVSGTKTNQESLSVFHSWCLWSWCGLHWKQTSSIERWHPHPHTCSHWHTVTQWGKYFQTKQYFVWHTVLDSLLKGHAWFYLRVRDQTASSNDCPWQSRLMEMYIINYQLKSTCWLFINVKTNGLNRCLYF